MALCSVLWCVSILACGVHISAFTFLLLGPYYLYLEEIKLNRIGHFQSLQFSSGVCAFEWNSLKKRNKALNKAIRKIALFGFSAGNTISVYVVWLLLHKEINTSF